MLDEFEENLVKECDKAGDVLEARAAEALALRESYDRDDQFRYFATNLLSPHWSWAKAVSVVNAVDQSGDLWDPDVEKLRSALKAQGVWPNRKMEHIVKYREQLWNESSANFICPIEDFIHGLDALGEPSDRRDLLVDKIDGMGHKTAGHFLRGVALSENKLAILDTHLNQAIWDWPRLKLVADGFVSPSGEWKKKQPGVRDYLEIERRLVEACGEIGIEIDKLDWMLFDLAQNKTADTTSAGGGTPGPLVRVRRILQNGRFLIEQADQTLRLIDAADLDVRIAGVGA